MAKLPNHPDELKMTLGEHLEELRRRVFISIIAIVLAMLLCLIFVKPLVKFLAAPVLQALNVVESELPQVAPEPGVAPAPQQPRLVVLTPMELFVTSMKTALVAALIIASPVVFHQMWLFVAAGLYPHERRIVHIFIPFSAALFVVGTAFAYKIVLRFGLPLLLNFQGLAGDLARPTIQLSAAINFVVSMSAVMGLVFQLPLVMMIIAKVGLVQPGYYVKYWRHATVAIIVAAAVLTPPDVFSQLSMAIPMVGLYWLGVLLSKLTVRKKAAAEAAKK